MDPNLPKGYPTNEDEWWYLFNLNRDKLRCLVARYHPSDGVSKPMPITAPTAEATCATIRKEIAAERTGDVLGQFDLFVEQRMGPQLARILNEAWFGLPESMSSREVPGFGAL